MARYIMLRRNTAASSGGIRGQEARADTGAARVETADLTTRDRGDAVRDPTVVAMARAMPTRLIAPEPLDDVRADEAEPAWGIGAIGATEAAFSGEGMRVAVLDTGIDADHPAFTGVTILRRDFSGSGDADHNGHGTHCAGTIFGRDVDGQRIGVAPGVTEVAIGKVLADDGRGSSEMLIQGMLWAMEKRAKVISMSLGFDFPGMSERLVADGYPVLLATSVALEAYRMNLRLFDAVMQMLRARVELDGGAVVVGAAGNESRRQVSPDFEVGVSVPAAAQGVVSVGALGQGDGALTIAPFSNSGPVISAPGVGIVSAASGGGLRALNGTSMATPHVAGAAVLWWQALGQGANAAAVTARLRASARRDVIAAETDRLDVGEGLVQVPGSPS